MANSEVAAQVHPAVLQLGLRYADGSVRGASARCVAMLVAFRTLVQVRWAPAPQIFLGFPSAGVCMQSAQCQSQLSLNGAWCHITCCLQSSCVACLSSAHGQASSVVGCS